jgi:hypothetical protein
VCVRHTDRTEMVAAADIAASPRPG